MAVWTGSSDVRQWRLSDLNSGQIPGRLGGIVSKWIWRVLACPIKTHKIGSLEIENHRGNRVTQVYLENGCENKARVCMPFSKCCERLQEN